MCGAYDAWPQLPLLPSALASAGGLSGRSFTGTIPTEYGLLTALFLLDLSDNSLTSNVPTELGLLSVATSFWIDSNLLCAALPTQVQALSARLGPDWKVIAGNSLGTPCPSPSSLSPTGDPSSGVIRDDDDLDNPPSTSVTTSSTMSTGEVIVIVLASLVAVVAIVAVSFRYREQASTLLQLGEDEYVELAKVADDELSAGGSSDGLSSSAWQYCLDSWQGGSSQVRMYTRHPRDAWCGMARCGMAQCGAVLRGAVLCCAVRCGGERDPTVPCTFHPWTHHNGRTLPPPFRSLCSITTSA